VKAGVIGSDDADARFDGCVGARLRDPRRDLALRHRLHNANHWLHEAGGRERIPLGNAILTSTPKPGPGARPRRCAGQGADAVRACLASSPSEQVYADEDLDELRQQKRGGMSAAGL
jgi:hypothetical protein